VIVAACGASPEPEPETDSDSEGEPTYDYNVLRGAHVEIRHFAHLRVCGGDLAALDAHVPIVADMLGRPGVGPFVYEWVDDDEVERRCGGPAYGGCVREGIAYGKDTGIGFHELNHLIAGSIDGSTAMWVEGLASAFEPRTQTREQHHPLVMLEQGRSKLSYPTAGHFFLWVWNDVGAASTLAVAGRSHGDDIDGALEAFEEEIGEPLASYGDRYLADAPERLPSLLPTEDPLPWTDDRWAHVFELDCAADHTRVGYGGDELVRTAYVEVTREGAYELAVSGGVATLYGVVGSNGFGPVAVPFDGGNFWSSPEYVDRGQLGEGRFVVAISSDGPEPQTIAVELRPVLGPLPHPPE
jgi:hypothetical protein